MTDREEAGLRGSVRICVEETTYPTGKSLTTTEYGPDGRLLTTRTSNSDGSECFTTKTYEADGRLVKTSSAKSGEPATETRFIVRIEGFSGRFAPLGRASLDQAAISFVCLRGEAF